MTPLSEWDHSQIKRCLQFSHTRSTLSLHITPHPLQKGIQSKQVVHILLSILIECILVHNQKFFTFCKVLIWYAVYIPGPKWRIFPQWLIPTRAHLPPPPTNIIILLGYPTPFPPPTVQSTYMYMFNAGFGQLSFRKLQHGGCCDVIND